MASRLLKQLCDLDIFTLMVFKTIYETGHANITARELSVSAPKISRCLSSLRLAFDDELFYRRQQKLKATPLAENLYRPVCDFIQSVYQLELQANGSRDCRAEGCLHIAVGYGLMSALSKIFGQKDMADKLGKVRLYKWQSDSADLIHSGELDLGISMDLPENQELQLTNIGECQEIGLVCRKDHPIWQQSPNITLEQIARYPFVYMCIRNFNERIDPFELYCQQENIPTPEMDCVEDFEEWYAHLLTMNSIAFVPATELCQAERISELKCRLLPASEVNKLQRTLALPCYQLIEKADDYRRYSTEQRQLILDVISKLLSFRAISDERQFGT
ncbi:LysR family transcriptional regulator [Shewanella sp. A32]|uniref:LysR substrate-binding domain-containing protein n=1 Tax=Shewanella sp. A32 TaxID=3031327 RepID=UPI0023B90B85|nr:LysR family transcriptional regulator [Shewanella sp. A32]MDF0535686.1 LysR family transcriptional regulator [Shewanella sp. A32]